MIGLFRPEDGLVDSPSPQDETAILLVEEEAALLGKSEGDQSKMAGDEYTNSKHLQAFNPTLLK